MHLPLIIQLAISLQSDVFQDTRTQQTTHFLNCRTNFQQNETGLSTKDSSIAVFLLGHLLVKTETSTKVCRKMSVLIYSPGNCLYCSADNA